MDISGKIAIVTGGAQGIGRALSVALHGAGATKVIVCDLDLAGAEETASMVDGVAYRVDVTDENQVEAMILDVEKNIGPVDLMCSNAGIATGQDNTFDNAAFASSDVWEKAWAVNVMAHVYAARVLIPLMKSRGGGYFLHTVSAAGLLNQIGSAVYGTTKHAAVGFAENLALTHRDDGIKVSILCPQGVDTPMLHGLESSAATIDGILSAETVADISLQGIKDGQFLILPHEKVGDYLKAKPQDYDRWIGGMAKLQRHLKLAQ